MTLVLPQVVSGFLFGFIMTQYEYLMDAIKTHGDNDECLLWPFKFDKDGYPSGITIDNKPYRPIRLVLEYKLGRSIKSKHLACHTHTGNRHCFNPNHLYEGTDLQNQRDRLKDGTVSNGEKQHLHKLTEKQVLEIRVKYIPRVYTQQRLADEYGVHQTVIGFIVRGQTWKHI
jgi:hypothetical protein